MKRFLISILIVIAALVLIFFGASYYFISLYDNSTANTNVAAATPTANVSALMTPMDSLHRSAETDSNNVSQAVEPAASLEEPAQVAANDISPSSTSATEESILSGMTLEEKVSQMMFVTPESLTDSGTVTEVTDALTSTLSHYPVGGIILNSDNLESRSQTTSLNESLQTAILSRIGVGMFIGVDEEGGSVARVSKKLGTASYFDMSTYGANGDIDLVYDIGSTLATHLLPLGFNVNFAPVADVLTNEDNTVIGNRSFGSDPYLVADMVAAEIHGLNDTGMLSAAKHFPGHGSTTDDTHDGYASTDRSLEELETCDLIPFQAAIEAGTPMIMVGHMTVNAIDSSLPASLSSVIVTDLLRNQMGYTGIIITDAMNMGAITNHYSCGESAVLAIKAGCDMILAPSDPAQAIDTILSSVYSGEITENRINESVLRILQTKRMYGLLP